MRVFEPYRKIAPKRTGRFIVKYLPTGKTVHGILFDEEQPAFVYWYGSFKPAVVFGDRIYVEIKNEGDYDAEELIFPIELPTDFRDIPIHIIDNKGYIYQPIFIGSDGYGTLFKASCGHPDLDSAGIPTHARKYLLAYLKNVKAKETRRLEIAKADITCPVQPNATLSDKASNRWRYEMGWQALVYELEKVGVRTWWPRKRWAEIAEYTTITGADGITYEVTGFSGWDHVEIQSNPKDFVDWRRTHITTSPYGWVFETRIFTGWETTDPGINNYSFGFDVYVGGTPYAFAICGDRINDYSVPRLVIVEGLYSWNAYLFAARPHVAKSFYNIYRAEWGDLRDIWIRIVNDRLNNRLIFTAKSMYNGVTATVEWYGKSFDNTEKLSPAPIPGGGHYVADKYYVLQYPILRPLYKTTPSMLVAQKTKKIPYPHRESSFRGKSMFLSGIEYVEVEPVGIDLSPTEHSVLMVIKPLEKTEATLFSKAETRPEITENLSKML
jgi:hypothetical protein